MLIASIICLTVIIVAAVLGFFFADDGDVGRDIVDRICESKEKREQIKADAYKEIARSKAGTKE